MKIKKWHENQNLKKKWSRNRNNLKICSGYLN